MSRHFQRVAFSIFLGAFALGRIVLADENKPAAPVGGEVLAATSHTNRTSPTKRGKWVLDVIFGNPPPPPPPNAGMFKDEEKNKI